MASVLNCFVFSNPQNRTDTSQSQTYKYFPQISQWISDFLGRNGDMTASLIGNNMLVKQVKWQCPKFNIED